MAKLLEAFDADQHEEMSDFEPIPVGVYPVQISNSDIVVTKAKDGKYIKLEFSVLSGEFKGRKIWTNLNIVNKNPVTVEIANKELTSIVKACGKRKIQDTVELHGIPIMMTVGIKPASGDFGPQNVPKKYEPTGVKPPANKAGTKKTTKPKTEKPAEVAASGPGWDEEETE